MIQYRVIKIFSRSPIVYLSSHFSFIIDFLRLIHILDHSHLLVFTHPTILIDFSLSIHIYFSEHYLFEIMFLLLLEAYFLRTLPIRLLQILILLYYFFTISLIHFTIFATQLRLKALLVLSKVNLLMKLFIQYQKMIC